MGCDIHPVIITNDNKVIKFDLDRNYELFAILFDVRYSFDNYICQDIGKIHYELENLKHTTIDDYLNGEDFHSHCFCTLADIEIFYENLNFEISEKTEDQLDKIKNKMIELNGKYFFCCFDN